MILVYAPTGHADLLHPDELRHWLGTIGAQVATVIPDPTADQLDGLACVECGKRSGPMAPVASLNAGQLFAHDDCEAA